MSEMQRYTIEPYSDMAILDENGKWVTAQEAMKAIAAKDAEIKRLRGHVHTTADGEPFFSGMVIWTTSDDDDNPKEFGSPVVLMVDYWDERMVWASRVLKNGDDGHQWCMKHNETWSTSDLCDRGEGGASQ